MSDLQVEATQPTRTASTARSNRLTPQEAADLSATFDQIFATISQNAWHNTPQSTPTPSIATDSLTPVVAPVIAVEPARDVERADGVEPVAEDAPEAADSQVVADAPQPATSPSSVKSLERADHGAPKAEGQPAPTTRDSATERHGKQGKATHKADSAEQSARQTPGKSTLQSRNKETAPAAKYREAPEEKSELPAHEGPTKTSTKSEAKSAAKRADVAPETRAAETAPASSNSVKPTAAQPTVAVAAAVAAKPVNVSPHAETPRDSRHDRPPAKQPAPQREAPPSGVNKSGAPARPSPEAPAAPHETPQRAIAPAKQDAVAKVTSQSAEKTSASRVEPVETAKTMATAKSDATAKAEPVRAERPTGAEQSAADKPSPFPARHADNAVAASVPPDAPAVDRRRPRETRSAVVASTSEARSGGTSPPSPAATSGTTAPANATPVAPVAAGVPVAPVNTATIAARPVNSASAKPEVAPLEGGGVSAAPATTPQEPHGRARVVTEEAKTAATKRAAADPQHEVDRVRLIQRVAKALQTAQDRGGTLRLRLTPPELGALKIELIMRDGALSARLEAETPAAKSAILENLPALRERLTSQEIKIERFDVDLMQQSDHSGGERQSFADAESSREQADLRRSWRNERSFAKPVAQSAERGTPSGTSNGGLNVLA